MGKAKKRKRNIYTPTQIAFLAKNIPGRSYADMLRLFNRRFKLSLTFSQMKSLLKNHKLVNGFGYGEFPHERKYLDKHVNYLRKIVPGTPFKVVLEKFNAKFNFSIGIDALGSLCVKYGITNGRDCRFKKGNVSFNKGKKGLYFPGCEKGWFKKGGMPPNTMPLGSERVTADGYVEVKISEKSGPPNNRWKGKHILVWESEHGPVPEGSVITFVDGDKHNFDPDNLRMISRAELAFMCHNGMFSDDEQMTKLGYDFAALKAAISRRKKKHLTA